MTKEVNKLLKAKFIRKIEYPTRLTNVVMVKKTNGEWRMCVDYTSLNKAYPKDYYKLPRIDTLVDSTNGYEFLCFMNAFSGYHQIKMRLSDQVHSSSRAVRAIYCYNVMAFGLNNAGATYQRIMNHILQSKIGKNVKAYVDDMVIKTKRGSSHLHDLEETFANLSKYNLKLNPTKCAYRVKFGKFLGFITSERGIEANSEKIDAIMRLTEPRCIKDIQRMNGCIAALGRFISKSVERCLPSFKALKVLNIEFMWREECGQALEELKVYLSQLPLLRSPVVGEILYLYLSSFNFAIPLVLIKEEISE